jgi:hypothetical protein
MTTKEERLSTLYGVTYMSQPEDYNMALKRQENIAYIKRSSEADRPCNLRMSYYPLFS